MGRKKTFTTSAKDFFSSIGDLFETGKGPESFKEPRGRRKSIRIPVAVRPCRKPPPEGMVSAKCQFCPKFDNCPHMVERPRSKTLTKRDFSRKLLKALGDSHEARELTSDLVGEFYKDYVSSWKSFQKWFSDHRRGI